MHSSPLRTKLSLTIYVQDYPYLSPIIKEIEAEAKERADLENLSITKKK
jgi:hypothetical protein